MIRWLYYALRRWYYRNVYLKSGHWRAFRLKALEAALWVCEYPDCSAVDHRAPMLPGGLGPGWHYESLDIHHLTYENLWHEKLKDVSVLCRRHHIMIEKEKYPH